MSIPSDGPRPVPAAPATALPRPFRIFVSSPGDLGDERLICARVIERLKGEFARAARLQAILWEQEPLTADAGFQDQIPLPSQTDIVVLLLWSRLGYRLHSKYRAAGEAEAPTGTLFEFRDAVEARRRSEDRVPDVMVYRKTAEPPRPSIADRDNTLRALEDWQRVEEFFNSEFFRDNEEGAFVGAYHTFKRTGDFEENFALHLRALIARRLGEDQGGTVAGGTAAAWLEGSPFRGLEAFDFEHRALFAGRARAAAEVRDALRRRAAAGCAFVLVMGMSGGGKSSLVRAGVLPDLVQPGVIEGIGLWRRAVLRPGEAAGGDLFLGLATALLADHALPELREVHPDAVAALATRLRQHPATAAATVEGALRQAADAFRAAERERLLALRRERDAVGQHDQVAELDGLLADLKPPQARLALVVDQMEELWTDARVDAAGREAFVAVLDALARGGRTWVLATLRSDFFAQCESVPALVELKAGEGTYHLLPPTGAELSRMIRHPAAAGGLRYERDERTQESLADVLLAAAARDPGALPLLSFTLDELYKRANADGNRRVLTRADLDALGGLEGALATRAEQVFNDLLARDERAAKALPAVFGALARVAGRDAPPGRPRSASSTPTGGRPGGASLPGDVVSRTAPLSAFTDTPGAPELVHAMVEARLLTSDRGEVRVAHEALLRHWGRARDWIAENTDFLRARARVAEAAARWRTENRADDFLLPRGKPLVEGEDLLTRRGPELLPEEREFIAASTAVRRREERLAARRRRQVLTTVSTAGALAAGFAVVSFWQFRVAAANARRATHARDEAEKLIEFMGVNLRDKLAPIGRLELLDDANRRVRAYYDSFAGQTAADPAQASNILGRQAMALFNQGDILKARGDLPGALTTYRECLALRERLAAAEPAVPLWRGEAALARSRLADVLAAQGDTPGALAAYREALAARRDLMAREPANPRWSRDVAASHVDLGGALATAGDLPGALAAYREALAIDQDHVAREPANPDWQHDLFASHLSVGDILLAQNDPAGALAAYRAGAAVQERLCATDPRNAPWQRDRAVAAERVADALAATGDRPGALRSLREAKAIHARLSAQDLTNTVWLRDGFVCGAAIGDLLLLDGDAPGALDAFTEGQAIQQRLADQDPSNAGWQRDLSAARERVGLAKKATGDLPGALTAFRECLAERRRLAATDPANAGWSHDAFVSLTQVGDVLLLQRDAPAALAAFREAVALQAKLSAADSTNADWQRDLAETEDKVGTTLLLLNDAPAAVPRGRAALATYETLLAANPADAGLQGLVATVSVHLGQTLARLKPVPFDEARAALERGRNALSNLQKAHAGKLETAERESLIQAEAALQTLKP